MKSNIGLVEYAKAQLGRPYWFGTFGQTATQALYDYNKARLLKYYTASDFPSQFGQRVHDCIGLVKGYLWSDGPDATPAYRASPCAIDHNADSMRAACKTSGAISTIPEMPGVLVFATEHVGVYIGGGKVIEARGHAYGVVETNLKDRAWTYWGLCPYIDYIEEDDTMTGKEIYEALNNYTSTLTVPDWAQAEFQEAIKAGITDGSNPMQPIPRYQAAIMALRASKK